MAQARYCGTECTTNPTCDKQWSTDPNELRYVWLSGCLTIFFCWFAQEVMERAFGMAPQIRTKQEMESHAKQSDNPVKTFKLNRRLTKSLDHTGRFRIQRRGTINYIKSVWSFGLVVMSLCFLATTPEWFQAHFFDLDPSTVNWAPYQHISASILCFYCWEVATNRYGRLDYSILMHHWLTAAAALSILLGVYTPFATWYGFTNVGMAFAVDFTMGLRATYSNRVAHLTRKLFICTFVYYVVIMCMVFLGEIYLIVLGFVTGKIPIASEIIMIFTMFGWAYDDINLLRALYDFSTHEYENAEVFDRKYASRELGGRKLFAMSVIHDMTGGSSVGGLSSSISDEVRSGPVAVRTISPGTAGTLSSPEDPYSGIAGQDGMQTTDTDRHATLERQRESLEMCSDELEKVKAHVQASIVDVYTIDTSDAEAETL
eukprot:206232_1